MPSGCALILTSFISTTTSDSACYDVAYRPIATYCSAARVWSLRGAWRDFLMPSCPGS